MKTIYFLVVLHLISCQFPVEQSELPETRKFMVIDAQITENYLQLNVVYSLQEVTSRGEYNLPNPPATSAYLADSKGVRYPIVNTRGVADSSFRGKVGETYQLFVLADGKSYESTRETMRACPDIDTIIVQYSREQFRARSDVLYDGFDIYAQTQDVAGQENYYQWEWTHYRKALYCSKLFSQVEKMDLLVPCNPPECWNIVTNTRAQVESDKLRDGKIIVHPILRAPFAIPPNKYYLRIEQRAITPTVFAHFNSIKEKAENLGTLFDVPAQTSFNPNVFNVNDRGEKIIGAFNVFSSRYRIIHIDMLQKIPGADVKYIYETEPFVADPFVTSPCIEAINRTKIKPEGWID